MTDYDHDHDHGAGQLEQEVGEYRRSKRPPPAGKATLTSRLGASPASIARAVVAQLRAADGPATAPATAVQASGDLDGPDVHALAAQGTGGDGGPLPFLDEIQRSFGHHDVSGVRAHVGGAAADASAAMGARAYAAGDAVAFADAPDLHLAAHEAAHVVQQRGGVRLSDGVGRAGDAYERHADAVADAVVRGENAQPLLDGMAHRGAAGGPAVQHDPGPGVRALQELLLRNPAPPAAEIVAIIRQHPREMRPIVAAVRERCGAELAASVQRTASILPEQAALAAQPPPGGGPDLGAPGPGPASPAIPQPTVRRGDGGSVEVTGQPDENSSVRARGRTSGADGSAPALRDVRVVVSGERRDASGELSATVRADGGAGASAEGAVRTDGGTVLRGQAEAEVEPGDHGAEARASAGATVEIPLDDRNTLIAGGVIHSDGRLDLTVGVDILHRRVRDLPISEAARRPLLRLFVNVTTPLEGGTPAVSGGAAVQFARTGGGATAGDRHASLLGSLLGPNPGPTSPARVVQREQGGATSTEDPDGVRALATAGIRDGGAQLPHLEAIQRSFGEHDVSGVVAHVGGRAAEAAAGMGAVAYAAGDHVAFADTPSLHLAAHEAAHVVQQRAGVSLAGGVGKTGDTYERHADEVADRVVRGESAADLLGGSRGGATAPRASAGAVQRHGGGERNRPAHLRRTVRVPATYAELERTVEQWIAGQVASRSRADGRPTGPGERVPEAERIRRERELVRNNASLRRLWEQVRALQGEEVEITAHLDWGPNRIEQISFTTNRGQLDFDDGDRVRAAPNPNSPEEQQRVQRARRAITAGYEGIPRPGRGSYEEGRFGGSDYRYLAEMEGYISMMRSIFWGNAATGPDERAHLENNVVTRQAWARPGAQRAVRDWNAMPVHERQALRRAPGEVRQRIIRDLESDYERVQTEMANSRSGTWQRRPPAPAGGGDAR